ncbi:hypothetical protein Bxe_A1244 [Paraburkholderia xenovorans LB400]|uniref:Uncharacterized protein n=1 Tax=Paraburkholderia xenovorans (strain LB400) TaxID=266265 RepID=Q13W30_PARXL|nr:hypothetical protein Bxe_A1244 [Paraburkholderia xenovorans LB400]
MDRLGREPRPAVTVCACAGKRTHDTYVDKLSEISVGLQSMHYRCRPFCCTTTFQSLYVVTKAKHFANPCFLRQFYSGNWLAVSNRPPGAVNSRGDFAGKR